MNNHPQSLTEGTIWKKMLLFALPVFLGNVLQQFYNTFDTWVVGKFLGDNALAAVSSSGVIPPPEKSDLPFIRTWPSAFPRE